MAEIAGGVLAYSKTFQPNTVLNAGDLNDITGKINSIIGILGINASNSITLKPDATVTAAHFFEASDINLKKNIESIKGIDNIPVPKKFEWKSNSKTAYGFIALELEEYYPELVEVDTETGYKKVNYTGAIVLTLGKLMNRIDELEAEVLLLKNNN